MKPFPIGGLIPWNGSTVKILRHFKRDGLDYYDLQGMSNFEHAMLLRSIQAAAKFQVGDTVKRPKYRMLTVMARKWSFKVGDVLYLLGDPRVKMGSTRWVEQSWIVKQQRLFDQAEKRDADLEDAF
jgi:hypothetical protein